MTGKFSRYTAITLPMFVLLCVFCVTYSHFRDPAMIYIILWTEPRSYPFDVFGRDNEAFTNRDCAVQNCVFTNERSYFSNMRHFDAFLFNVAKLTEHTYLPERSWRMPHQMFIMFSLDPPELNPLHERYKDYFNMTWTYRLKSNLSISYFVVKDENSDIVAPKLKPLWRDILEMNETGQHIKDLLQTKKIAAAWMISNTIDCVYFEQSPSYLMYLGLKNALQNHGHRIDVYGNCGTHSCEKDKCKALIEHNYYFYLAFEDYFDTDFVTDKVLIAIDHFSVPIVYGGAKYNRFLPYGMYLDAYDLGATKTAMQIVDSIANKEKYYDFFKYYAHYSFQSTSEDHFSREVCDLCAFLNEKREQNDSNTFHEVTSWFAPPQHKFDHTVHLSLEERNEEGLLNNWF